jgi:hypothetical protein
LALLLTTPALADARDAYNDGIVTESATVPQWNTVRLATQGGSFGAQEGFTGGISALWSFWHGLEINAQGVLETTQHYDKLSQISPQFGFKWQALSQDLQGVNMALEARYKTIGFDPSTGEVELWINVGRQFGRILVVVNAVGGHDTQADGGEDLEAHLQVDYGLLDQLSLGLESRFRTGRDPQYFPTFGSSWDFLVGPHAAAKLGAVRIQALLGFSTGAGPNFNSLGLTLPGFFGMLALSGDLH